MITDIPIQWLRERGTPEEFELAELERKAKAFNLPFDKVAEKLGGRPFGSLTDDWHAFVKKMKLGEELWFFSSPDETFSKKLGCQGYAIVSEEGIREVFVTLRT